VDVAECHKGDDDIPRHRGHVLRSFQMNFLDGKHIVNGDTLLKMVCADPLTGYVDAIPVSGDFRDAHNVFAVVSGSPTKSVALPII
jgi:hypothetical protein